MSRYVTVVYAIEDEGVFRPVLQGIQKQIAEFDVNNRSPLSICAVSLNDEIQRLEMIEEAFNDSDLECVRDTIQDILSMTHLPEPN